MNAATKWAAFSLAAGLTMAQWPAAAQNLFSPGPLSAAHASLNGVAHCGQCHTSASGVSAPLCLECHQDVKHSIEEKKGWHGHIEARSSACQNCHHEHRGAVNDSLLWGQQKSSFRHAKTGYVLTGAHKQASCKACHNPRFIVDPNAKDHYAKRKPEEFYLGLSTTCASCHTDVHKSKFGATCTACHGTSRWDAMNEEPIDNRFHETTRFALRGAHAKVACRSCHGPLKKEPAVFRGLKFKSCSDCHADAHENQFSHGALSASSCDECHRTESFFPAEFTVTEHNLTRYPLQGAHKTVACNKCHKKDPKLSKKVSPIVRAKLKAQKRPEHFSFASFRTHAIIKRCDACHTNPHDNQFSDRIAKKGCVDCHKETSFLAVSFDHDKEANFPLAGAHAQVACTACHSLRSEAGVIVYEGLSSDCANCHKDVHMGQLVTAGNTKTACGRCHTVENFSPAIFNHNDPNISVFRLIGKHAEAACKTCHQTVHVPGTNIWTVHYKPLSHACESCHKDYHQGQLDQIPVYKKGHFKARGAHHEAGCQQCHTQAEWLPTDYAPHGQVGFALTQGHADVACRNCHVKDFDTPLRSECSACHRDAHAGELGTFCVSCHSGGTWKADFDVRAHRMTNFPLRGAHGSIPCQECHAGFFSHEFRGTGATCDTCHHTDYVRAATTGLNHVASHLSTNCRNCHDPWQWSRATLTTHDTCFPINSGAHATVACSQCHTSLVGAVASGTCATGTATCIGCHAHQCSQMDTVHTSVLGYQCDNRACYTCHRNSR